MNDIKRMLATESSVIKWVGIVGLFWSGIVLIELAK